MTGRGRRKFCDLFFFGGGGGGGGSNFFLAYFFGGAIFLNALFLLTFFHESDIT